ncbi:MAG: hypothetical protein FJ285_07440 [Planctomycetes bacterium]|nr:hypothetical protein [Planctomycetota bacterium]
MFLCRSNFHGTGSARIHAGQHTFPLAVSSLYAPVNRGGRFVADVSHGPSGGGEPARGRAEGGPSALDLARGRCRGAPHRCRQRAGFASSLPCGSRPRTRHHRCRALRVLPRRRRRLAHVPAFPPACKARRLRGFFACHLGQFATAYQLAFLPSALLGSSIGSVFFQRASLDFAERRAFAPMWRNTLVRTTWMGLPICILTALAGPYMFPVLLSAKWEQAGRIAAILSVPAFFAFVTGSVDRCWAIVGVNWYMPALQLLKSASSLAAAGAAHVFKLTFDRCLFLLAFQMSAIYVLDGYWEMRFVQEADARSRRAFP